MINEIEEPIDDSEEKPKKPKLPHVIVKNTADYQRMKLEKLMKNPDKPVIIPERPKERGAPHVPDFVRNVMGSSAGAGSGEFHVYRHLRRKEYARQKYMEEKARREQLDNDYKQKLDNYKKAAEERTAKKRAKRLKKKQKAKAATKKPKLAKETSSEENSSEENEAEPSSLEEDNKITQSDGSPDKLDCKSDSNTEILNKNDSIKESSASNDSSVLTKDEQSLTSEPEEAINSQHLTSDIEGGKR